MYDELSDDSIRDLVRDAHPRPPFPAVAIRRRIARSRGQRKPAGLLGRVALAVAAALLVFVGGAEYGRRTAAPASPEVEPTPLAIQAAGSRWVAHLAAFTDSAPALAPAEREQARQVALAALYAASIELLRQTEDDDLLATVAELIEVRRQADRESSRPEPVSF